MNEETYLRIIHQKTAALFQAACMGGAYLSGTEKANVNRLGEYGLNLGMAFQIIDDIHGLTGMPGSTKTPGEDLITGKLTYVVYAALKRLPGTQQRRLAEILGGRLAAAERATLQEAVELVKVSGAILHCHAEAEQMTRRSWARLSKVVPACSPNCCSCEGNTNADRRRPGDARQPACCYISVHRTLPRDNDAVVWHDHCGRAHSARYESRVFCHRCPHKNPKNLYLRLESLPPHSAPRQHHEIKPTCPIRHYSTRRKSSIC